MTATASDIQQHLAAYTASLRAQGAIRSPEVEQAFRRIRRDRCVTAFWQGGQQVHVPQHEPIPEPLLQTIYSDQALVTYPAGRGGHPGSSTSMPSVIARMLEALELTESLRLLEIGAGAGYTATLAATITHAPVATVDADAQVAADAQAAISRLGLSHQVQALHADGYQGHPDRAPYERILATVGCAGVAPAWLEQLTDDGQIVVPLRHGGFEPTFRIRRDPHRGAFQGQPVMSTGFVHAAGLLNPHSANRLPRFADLGPPQQSVPQPLEQLGDAYDDLWFYLATRDSRITRGGMQGVDPGDGAVVVLDGDRGAVLIQQEALYHIGDPALLDHVLGLIADWDTLGRPALTQWCCGLAPTGPSDAVLWTPTTWTLAHTP